MALSVVMKQNAVYAALVMLSFMGSIFLYRSTQKEWIFLRQAEIKFQHKEFQAAIALYKKSVQAGLPMSMVIINLANSHAAIGKFKEAIPLYKKYLAIHPQDTKVRLELARALANSGDMDASAKEYKKILEGTHEHHQKN